MTFVVNLVMDRCTVHAADAHVGYQTIHIHNDEEDKGLIFTEFFLTEGPYDPGAQYRIDEREGLHNAVLMNATHIARNTVVEIVDGMEELGLDGRASFESGTKHTHLCSNKDSCMEYLNKLTANKPLLMEIRERFFGEKLSKAYESWGAW